jgi:hypothetical protein
LSGCTTCWRSSLTQSSRSTRHSSSEHVGAADVDHVALPVVQASDCAVPQLLRCACCGMRFSAMVSPPAYWDSSALACTASFSVVLSKVEGA